MKQAVDNKTVDLLDAAVFLAVGWIVLALLSRPLFGMNWFSPGDFSYAEAMYYHAIMVPVLILLFLLTRKILSLDRVYERVYAAGAMLAILLVGPGSVFNTSKGFSVAASVQILGMVVADGLGIVLVLALVKWARAEPGRARETGMAFPLLFTSLLAILLAAPLGHAAGWGADFGVRSIPGLRALIEVNHLEADEFLDGLVGSHSHLIVAALMSALAALAALFFGSQVRRDGRRWVCDIGLWVILVSLVLATVVYVVSAVVGWEPPVLFASGPNGIPLDDIILSALETGFLILIAGLSGSLNSGRPNGSTPIVSAARISIFLNWIAGFSAAVIAGIFIEQHERFFGAGMPSAPGALNDAIFIRAHLLFPFLLLPALFAVTLAVAWQYRHRRIPGRWPSLFVWTSVMGMVLGLAGEIEWFTVRRDTVFMVAVWVMVLALAAGLISLWPRRDK